VGIVSVDRKRELRAARLAARRAMPDADREAQDTALRSRLVDFLVSRAVRSVAAYVPLKGEPGGPELPAELALRRRLLLPVLLADNDLAWGAYTGALAPGRRGLSEPVGARVALSVDLMVVPALAVDGAGMRLGRGGGSYDRALAALAPATPAVALLYRGEFAPEPGAVPAEPHDRPVWGVLTPDGWIWM
jgi:5-formyltetrahydrofolate cyclo-ligase